MVIKTPCHETHSRRAVMFDLNCGLIAASSDMILLGASHIFLVFSEQESCQATQHHQRKARKNALCRKGPQKRRATGVSSEGAVPESLRVQCHVGWNG
jgi:hypothetical protein